MDVAKAPKWNVRSIGRSSVSDHNSYPRLSGWPCRTFAFPRSRSTRLRLARGYDGSHSKRDVGGATAPCSLDSRRGSAHHCDVGFGGDANPVSKATPGKSAATRLLRDQCLNSAQGTDSSCMYRTHLEEISEMADASGRGHSSSTGSGADDPTATSAFVRSKAGSNRRNSDEQSSRFSNSRSTVQGDWSGKAFGRKTVPTGNRNDVWEMAAATSAHARDAAFGRGRKSHACGSGVRLRYAERFHFYVQESLRDYAKFIF